MHLLDMRIHAANNNMCAFHNRVVGSVVLYGYFYIDAASLAVADLVCLDVYVRY